MFPITPKPSATDSYQIASEWTARPPKGLTAIDTMSTFRSWTVAGGRLRLKGTNAGKAGTVDTGFALPPFVQLQAPTLVCDSAETLSWKGIDAWQRGLL